MVREGQPAPRFGSKRLRTGRGWRNGGWSITIAGPNGRRCRIRRRRIRRPAAARQTITIPKIITAADLDRIRANPEQICRRVFQNTPPRSVPCWALLHRPDDDGLMAVFASMRPMSWRRIARLSIRWHRRRVSACRTCWPSRDWSATNQRTGRFVAAPGLVADRSGQTSKSTRRAGPAVWFRIIAAVRYRRGVPLVLGSDLWAGAMADFNQVRGEEPPVVSFPALRLRCVRPHTPRVDGRATQLVKKPCSAGGYSRPT